MTDMWTWLVIKTWLLQLWFFTHFPLILLNFCLKVSHIRFLSIYAYSPAHSQTSLLKDTYPILECTSTTLSCFMRLTEQVFKITDVKDINIEIPVKSVHYLVNAFSFSDTRSFMVNLKVWKVDRGNKNIHYFNIFECYNVCWILILIHPCCLLSKGRKLVLY
jgi:hypothetical protein